MDAATKRRLRRALLAAALAALPGPRARAAQDLLPEPRVRPPPHLETVPPSPGHSYEWAHGHWKWSGSAWVWVRGRYIVHRPWSYRWTKGYWQGSGGTEKWVPGYFGAPKRSGPYPLGPTPSVRRPPP
jgi:hypothetical protein